MENYLITFDFIKELEKSFMVKKKTKKINKVFFIPKSVIIDVEMFEQEKGLWKDVKYTKDKVLLKLPKWFCKKELSFYK